MKRIIEKIKCGEMATKQDLLGLLDWDLTDLMNGADSLRKECCGSYFELCTIINGKSGRCSENCKYCAQSSHYHTSVEEYGLMPFEEIKESALSNERHGVHRFSIVTSGRTMEEEVFAKVCDIYRKLNAGCKIQLCASHGLLTYEQLCRLREAGVKRYHNNLETSRRFFPSICTTHTYDDKIKTIQSAQKAGLEVCSGGIIGLGESMTDRIDMAITLRELNITSIPINVLNPIQGTPMEHMAPLSYEEIKRTFAIFRFALPNAQVRLAGGRSLLEDNGYGIMQGGANAAISGDMLTTSGITTADDLLMLEKLQYEVCHE